MKRIIGIAVLATALSASALAIAADSQTDARDCPPGCCGSCPGAGEAECPLMD